MAVATLVVVLVAVATYTDLKWRRIYNSLTYSGTLGALGINAIGSILDSRYGAAADMASRSPADPAKAVDSLAAWREAIGWVGLGDSALGLLACGGTMVVCYAMFRIGGGDVKLMAMIGAFLGTERGIESLLWTFVVGAGVALVTLIWRIGVWRLAIRFTRHLLWTLRLGFWGPLSAEERRELDAPLFLAPSALAAVAIVLASRQWNIF